MKRFASLLPGLALAAGIAAIAWLGAETFGGSALLYALLLGMALHVPGSRAPLTAGVSFSSGTVLRTGVALLGLRISLDQVMALGATPLVLVLASIPATLLFGMTAARLLGMSRSFGTLSGGAVAICGASAALAIAAVLPNRSELERQLIFTIVAVTALSTLAMIVYPLFISQLDFTSVQQGLFVGATIHNVPQAVGAGFTLSDTAGDSATFIKLLRVAMLAPVVLLISIVIARRGHASSGGATIPGFLIAFATLAIINSLGWVPHGIGEPLETLSHACLIVAIAAIGLKTSFTGLVELGWRPVLLVILETIFLAGLVLAGLHLLN